MLGEWLEKELQSFIKGTRDYERCGEHTNYYAYC